MKYRKTSIAWIWVLLVGLSLAASGWAQPAPPPAASPSPVAPSATEELLRKQAEMIQQLSSRLETLERQQASRDAGLEKAHQEQVQKLLDRIGQLEGKVGSLEGGRVLPEITVAPESGPTTTELEQKLKILERNTELAAEEAETRAKESPKLTINSSGFYLSTADTNYVLRLRGLVQVDSRYFFDSNPLNQGIDGFLLRRARPIFEGTVFHDFDFAIVPDFGPTPPQLFDAYINYKNRPELQFKVGKFKEPVGLEMLQSAGNLQFNERSLATDVVPNRDVGVQVWGQFDRWALTYQVGVFNGTGDGDIASNAPFDNNPEFAGRLFAQPFKESSYKPIQGLGLGLAGTFTQVSSNAAGLPNNIGGSLPGYWTAGQQQFFAYNPLAGPVVADGVHWRIMPQFYHFWGPFGMMGEYGISYQTVYNSSTFKRAGLQNSAWNLSAQWVVTGEDATYGAITPKHPLDFKTGGWGAWQVVARYGQLDIDDEAFNGFSNGAISASSAQSWSVGVNWWLNRNVRLMTSFSYTMFDGGGAPFNPTAPATGTPPATVTTQPESVFFTRLQVGF